MPPKKSSNETELEELLKAAESDENIEEVSNILTDVDSFLSAFDIRPGPNVIRVKLLYHLYCLWSKNPLSPPRFYAEINKFLLPHTKSTARYYLLNAKAFKLSAKSQELLAKTKIDKTKSVKYRRHFEAFLDAYGIKPGTYWIEGYLLYYLYDLWSFKRSNPLGEDQFHQFAKIYFKYRRARNPLHWFAVDKSILQFLPPEHIEQIRRARQLSNEKKKNKKKLSKIPRPPS